MNEKQTVNHPLTISESFFGKLPDGRDVSAFGLSNSNGLLIRILNYGGILQSIMTPDRKGVFKDIILGFNDLEGYLQDVTYQGAIAGRFANRIEGARFTLNGVEYNLTKNDGDNCLHGGDRGFNQVLWESQIILENDQEILRLQHVSPHGDQGFPGELRVTVDYSLNSDNEFNIKMYASTDRDTIVSLTLHPYFNLSGDFSTNILDHVLTVNSDEFLPVSSSQIPVSKQQNVMNTVFDFSTARKIGQWIGSDDEQLKITGGYDHYFIKRSHLIDHVECAEIFDPSSGRKLKVLSNAPGVQVYTGNYLRKDIIGKDGVAFQPYGGICIEPQAFPNSPNEKTFPSALLTPGEIYDQHILLQFSTEV